MSRVVVSNINSPNGTVSANVPAAPVTMSTANTLAGAAIVDNNSVYFLANSSINCTMNTTSIYLNGIDIVQGSSGGTETVIFSGNVTPAALTSNASAWNPDSTDIAYIIRVSANSASNTANTAYGQNYEAAIFGFSAGTSGQIYTIQNIGAQKIYFRTEDTVTETTAANRFNFPNHVVLDGGMSMELYYDGTLARWRMLDSINIPFEHKQTLTKAFFAGGGIPTRVITTDRTTYSTETTAAVTGADLSVIRNNHAGAGNGDKGFFVGTTASVDRTRYSTETTAAAFSLSPAKFDPAATGNADKGFWSGGTAPGPVTITTTDTVNYSTETSATISGAALSQARVRLAAVGNSDKGFFAGGSSTAPTVTVQTTAGRTTYSTETHAAVTGANLSQGRERIKAAGNSDKGFFSGGATPTAVATTGRTNYFTETHAAVTGANLSQARSGVAGAGNLDKGFFSGGNSTAPTTTVVATAGRTNYSTETHAAVTGANLSQARTELAAV